MLRIDKAEKAAFEAGGKYSSNLTDLVVADKVLARELTVPLTIDLTTGTGDKSYVVRVSSDVVSVARARSGGKVILSNCRTIKSVSGFKCPVPAAVKK